MTVSFDGVFAPVRLAKLAVAFAQCATGGLGDRLGHRFDEVCLVSKVSVEVAFGHPRFAGDLVDGDAFDPVFQEELEPGNDEVLHTFSSVAVAFPAKGARSFQGAGSSGSSLVIHRVAPQRGWRTPRPAIMGRRPRR